MQEQVILVDENDLEQGVAEKIEAHEKALLHRAFSLFVFNEEGELLMQKRAADKYHCPSLWTNTCCSHPRPGEKTIDAVRRRAKEEMGMDVEPKTVFNFIYQAHFENGLTEYEYDHVFFAVTNEQPVLNLKEVADWKYISISSLENQLQANGDRFTPWLKICFNNVKQSHKEIFG